MSQGKPRVVLVGASSLLGREIAEALSSGPFAAANVVLLDSEAEAGKLEEIGGEAVVLQTVEAASFEDADVVVFATALEAGRFWDDALRFGAAAVDATGTVQGLPVLSPLLGGSNGLSLESTGVAAAHPVATMLAAALLPLHAAAGLLSCVATVLQPVSENGAAALDELHQQTVGLLSFQTVPNEQHDAQVAFNLLPRLGEEAKLELADTGARVLRQLPALLGDAPMPTLQWIQAPVFHGYAISAFATMKRPMDGAAAEEALRGDLLEIAGPDDPPASNVAAAGGDPILVEVGAHTGSTLPLWLVTDNLKLLSRTVVACAIELLRMRPSSVLQ